MDDYPHRWIDNDSALQTTCTRLQNCKVLALDTEFMRSTTFFPKAALFQINDGECNYLIDPLPIGDFKPLIAVLVNPEIIKVFHSCSEDLEVFQTFLNCVPKPIADTQIAAALLNIASAVGYANLVKELLGLELGKGETRSDWLQRPLQNSQIHYAIQDVAYLLPVYHRLVDQLREQQRLEWFVEECDNLIAVAEQPVLVDDYYRKFKSAWKLDRRQLAILQCVSAWREHKARELDQPRNHIVPEKAVIELALTKVETVKDLSCLQELPHRKRKLFGEELVALVQQAKTISQDQLPMPLPKPLSQSQRDLLKILKATVESCAAQQHLPVDVLAKKQDLEFVIRASAANENPLPLRLQGWRKAIIGDQLVQEVLARK